jgi:hypothetical protein
MSVIKLLHSQALLAQIVDSKAAPTWDSLACKIDRPIRHFLNATECAISKVVEFGEFRIESLRIGAIEKGLISA